MAKFVEWLAPPREAEWLEIGCATGALTADCAPQSILSIDPSKDFGRRPCCGHYKIRRSRTPMTACAKATLNLICSTEGIPRVHTT
jgi:hypothetical protein